MANTIRLAEFPAGTSAVAALLSTQALPVPPDRASPTMARRFAVIGAHGGAGTSTVTAMLDPTRLGVAVEVSAGVSAAGRHPVLVARGTAYGTARAAELMADWPPRWPRPWLVLVADAPGDPPPAARFRLRVLSGRLTGVARLSYLHRLRCVDDPLEALTDRRVARVAARLRTLLNTGP
jgi:hypothetical protein